MRNWNLTLSAALLALSLNLPILAAETNQPQAQEQTAARQVETARPGELVARLQERKPRPAPETVDNRNDWPDYRANPRKSSFFPVVERKPERNVADK